ncbi:hypothetical protein Btru_003923 [Bulinus truncatus]|nr:hypothetical protein Btru_003923 [Bulinus truncatus]
MMYHLGNTHGRGVNIIKSNAVSLIPGIAHAFNPFHGHDNLERNRHQYIGQSRPDLAWERHIGLGDQSRYVLRTTTAPPATSTALSFGDYIRKATYEWLVKYKMAYFQDYFQNKSSAKSIEQPDSSVTYTASEASSNASLAQANTTAVNSSTSTPHTPITTFMSTRISTTTKTPTTLPTTTTVVTRAITIMDDYVNEIRGGFLPDQPNLGTRWTHNMDHQGHFIKS